MRSLFWLLCLLFFCLCAAPPVKAEEEPLLHSGETEKESSAQLHDLLRTFLGTSERALILRFRQTFPNTVARTIAISCLPDGGKKTSILWIVVSGNTTAKQGSSYNARIAMAYPTPFMDHLKCTAHFYSREGIITEYSVEGDNCEW